MSDAASTGDSERPVVRSYGSASAEYNALRSGVAMFDRSHRGRLRLHGARAAEMLNGLVSNDISALQPGQGCYAAALTAKGKIVADIRAFVDEHGVLTDVTAKAFDAWSTMVRKYVNPRLARSSDESGTLAAIGLFGVNARHVASDVSGVQPTALTALADYAHVSLDSDGRTSLVIRTPELGVEGFELIVPADQFEYYWTRCSAAGATPAGLDAWNIARVECGRPEWGVDMDDNTLPQEANFDELHAISYTKGCYVGQETVARVHFRGHVNKHLRGLRMVTNEDVALAAGSTLHDAEGLQVGDVRSAVHSPRLGTIALGMVRREIALGTELVARAVDASDVTTRAYRVVVSELPFPAQ